MTAKKTAKKGFPERDHEIAILSVIIRYLPRRNRCKFPLEKICYPWSFETPTAIDLVSHGWFLEVPIVEPDPPFISTASSSVLSKRAPGISASESVHRCSKLLVNARRREYMIIYSRRPQHLILCTQLEVQTIPPHLIGEA